MPQLQAFPLFFSEQANIFVSSCCQFFFSHTEKLQWFMMTFCASCFPKFSRGRQPFSNATLRQIQRQACSWAPPHQRSTSSRRCTNVFAPVSLGCKRRASRVPAAHAPPQCDGGRQRACACAPARRHTTRPFGAGSLRAEGESSVPDQVRRPSKVGRWPRMEDRVGPTRWDFRHRQAVRARRSRLHGPDACAKGRNGGLKSGRVILKCGSRRPDEIQARQAAAAGWVGFQSGSRRLGHIQIRQPPAAARWHMASRVTAFTHARERMRTSAKRLCWRVRR